MAGNELLFLEILLEDDSVENILFGEEDDCLLLHAGVLAPFMRRNLNRSRKYFEVSVPNYSLDEFKAHFRLGKATCEILLREVLASGHVPFENRFGRKVIDPSKQLLLFIWCMANQESTRLVADRFDVTYSSVTRIMRRVTKGIMALRNQYIRWPNDAQIQETIRSFWEQRAFPGVIGAVDGSLIRIRAPSCDSDAYVCRKKFHVLHLQVVCDDNMILLDAVTGWPGSVHDSRVLRNSSLYRTAGQKFTRDVHLLGDGGYPLLPWLITPFRDNGHLTADQRRFNRSLSSMRQVVERAFGLLKGRWRKLLYIDHLDVKFATKVIMAACVLHNFCLIHDDFDESYFSLEDEDNNAGNDDGFRMGGHQREAQHKRNHLMHIVCNY